jgi:glycosyltransferase involved in cell wall biosynthesis
VTVPRQPAGALRRALRVGSIVNAWRIRRDAAPLVDAADVVHVHSNGLLAETGALLANARRKPVVLTLYGTEIWHYRRRRFGPDLFTRAYRAAGAVAFYSERLLERARDLGLGRANSYVVYPPVARTFTFHDERARQQARESLGVGEPHLVVNVKRLHPLAGQRYLIEALGLARTADVRLVVCGAGPLLPELQAVARSAGVERQVTFAGLVDNATVARYCAAADLFVLPSVLEALPTVAVEALASGTPVLSSDNPGGLELHSRFGADVAIVPRENARALADAMIDFLRRPRRTAAQTAELIERDFRPEAVAAKYWDLYRRAGTRARP